MRAGYTAILLLFGSPIFCIPAAQAQTPNPSAPVRIRLNPKDNLNYVWIPAGTFQMGCSPDDSQCSEYEKPAHSVTISEGFWIGQTPVTQAAYKMVAGANPSHFRGDQLPVESITWDEAQAYCERVDMRLPSEAEWEYAARGGSTSARYGPIERIAWYKSNSAGTTHKVALKESNGYGLYDMLGNVDEWVADLYGRYDSSPSSYEYIGAPGADGVPIVVHVDAAPVTSAVDPKGPAEGQSRMVRGASWDNDAYFVSASNRMRYDPWERHQNVGFRCAAN